MTAVIVKMGDGFYIPKLEGFGDIKKDTISVDITLAEKEANILSYKELKGIAIMEKYYTKLDNQIEVEVKITTIQKKFRKNHNITTSLEQYLKEQ